MPARRPAPPRAAGPQRSRRPVRTLRVTDAELASRAAAGDADAFGALAEQHAPVARRLARALLANPHDADDAVQDGLLAAWRHIGRYDAGRPFGPWLMRIVVNAARDLRRRRVVRRTDTIPESAPAGGDQPDQATDRALLRRRLDQALATLSERQRTALVLFDAEGYSHGDIAAVLNIPEGTVRSDVFHARRALRAQLASVWEERR